VATHFREFSQMILVFDRNKIQRPIVVKKD